MASQDLRGDFNVTVELYSTFIKQIKASVPQMNVSEFSFARGTNKVHGGGGSQTGNGVPLESLMSIILLLMTDSLTSMSTNNSPVNRRTLSVSSD